MLWPAESFYGGTWGGGELPVEVCDFELMQAMGWSWSDLEATPAYVIRYCSDLINIKRAAENEAHQRAERRAEREAGRHGR